MIRAVAKAASREIIMQTASDTSVTLEDCLFHESRFYFEGQTGTRRRSTGAKSCTASWRLPALPSSWRWTPRR
jgi:hypothetical protein